MHKNQQPVTLELVRSLLAEQFPQFAGEGLSLMKPEGTDNYIYSLGSDKVLRLPRMESAADTLAKETKWLPKFSDNSPIEIPKIVGIGRPSDDYPFDWLICSRLSGTNPSDSEHYDYMQAAIALARFIQALQKTTTADAPTCKRAKSLRFQDAAMQESIPQLPYIFNRDLISRIWKKAVSELEWRNADVWVHGDLHPGNILCDAGKVSGIIDFGMSGIGDPAADMMVAWTFLEITSRKLFKDLMHPDEATWNRGRGWALCLGVVAYPYYIDSNPIFADIAKRTID